VALDPGRGELVGEDVAKQTEQVMKNLSAVLAGAGLTLHDVVKTTVYLTDMAHFQAMNEVYARHFTDAPPARTTVAAAGLPKGALVEIDAVAVGREY
jgi:2-iminobutanoate/2-iminopropanoate deaminase